MEFSFLICESDLSTRTFMAVKSETKDKAYQLVTAQNSSLAMLAIMLISAINGYWNISHD